mgnify:CR=1 FL=1
MIKSNKAALRKVSRVQHTFNDWVSRLDCLAHVRFPFYRSTIANLESTLKDLSPERHCQN